MIPEWLQPTLQALPAVLWMVIGLGIPWTLVALPRRDWSDRAMVACLSLLFGPALLTVWMFTLGTLGMDDHPDPGATPNPMQTRVPTHIGGEALLTPERILIGTAVIALIGALLAWRKWRTTSAQPATRPPLYLDEKLLIALIVVASIARWFITSYLQFGSWDELWVYGYQGRLYTLIGYIPADIGYYPQFLPLQYAYTQIMTGGVNDHAARAVVPFLQWGSILATYLLGSRLFNRRTGIAAAALWALYPHFGYWTRIGDLETPVTFGFTAAAAFFLMAWTAAPEDRRSRRHYALLAGLCFGVAMWTKPTAGAFVWGVVLMVIAAFGLALLRPSSTAPYVRSTGPRAALAAWLPRFEVAFWTGLACVPLGGLWYARNILLRHDAVVFPASVWLTRAERSGAEFGWPLLGLGLLLAYLFLGPHPARPDWRRVLPGVALIAAAIVPSILDPHRMGVLEWLALAAGTALVAWALLDHARAHLAGDARRAATIVLWAQLLAVPYFITWFYSYSYHYRLSFAIVPLMLLPAAVVLARWLTVARVTAWQPAKRLAYGAALLTVTLYGAAIFAYDETVGWDWLDTLGDTSGEGSALDRTVRTIEDYIATHDEPPVIIAPGAQRLPFYFPLLDIQVAVTPRRYTQVDGATHFIWGSDAIVAYTSEGQAQPYQNQFLAGLRRDSVATRVAVHHDIIFFFEIFELHPDRRFDAPPVDVRLDEAVIVGDFARLVGYNRITEDTTLTYDGDVIIELVWEVLSATDRDYVTFTHLPNPDPAAPPYQTWDVPTVFWWDIGNYYSTRFWEPGEFIVDRRWLRLFQPGIPAGTYQPNIGLYTPEDGVRAPITIGGEPAGDMITLPLTLTVEESP